MSVKGTLLGSNNVKTVERENSDNEVQHNKIGTGTGMNVSSQGYIFKFQQWANKHNGIYFVLLKCYNEPTSWPKNYDVRLT